MAGEQRDPLDRLLDDALAAYVNQEPRPGLERRVLNRVRAEGARPRFAFLGWASPAAVLGCLLAVVLWNNRATVPAAPEMARAGVSPTPVVDAATESGKPLRRQPGNTRRASVPKQAEFPVPTPLTRQERALVAFVSSAPDEALQTFGQPRPPEIEPLWIDEIELPPLQIGDGAK